jgi:hypothetical protein
VGGRLPPPRSLRSGACGTYGRDDKRGRADLPTVDMTESNKKGPRSSTPARILMLLSSRNYLQLLLPERPLHLLEQQSLFDVQESPF